MAWCHVKKTVSQNPIFDTLSEDARFYFVHSYYLSPARTEDVLLTANYGGIEFAAAVGRGNVMGVQFHPEKSHRFGKQLLAEFAGRQS